MVIKTLELTNFRNYQNLKIDFSPNINIIYGDNGQGKTNLLEGIYVLGLTTSYRSYLASDLINKNSDLAQLRGKIVNNKIPSSLNIIISNNSKKLKIDKNHISLVSNYINKMNIVIFHPEDINLVKGSPNNRRTYLNTQLSQIHQNYYKLINDYNKILKQRNELLKRLQKKVKIDTHFFNILTESLIERAFKIYQYRNNYIKNINKNISKIYNDIMNNQHFKLEYIPSIRIESYMRDELITNLKKTFNDNYLNEIKIGSTISGPHRDDFQFILDDNNIKTYGSQGQQRAAILSLKLSEIPIFKFYKNTYPILLLDDVFSELDDKKKNNLLKYIINHIQTFITTTDIDSISPKLLEKSKLFEIKQGKIIEEVQ